MESARRARARAGEGEVQRWKARMNGALSEKSKTTRPVAAVPMVQSENTAPQASRAGDEGAPFSPVQVSMKYSGTSMVA
jgi:hypothetical protein